MERRFPAVLLLGNGLNRAYACDSCAKLIEKLWANGRVSKTAQNIGDLPFPMRIVLATDDRVQGAIDSHPELFCGAEDVEPLRAPLDRLLSLDFDHLLTTNYSYEIERVADGRIDRAGKGTDRLMRHTSAVKKAEPKYLLHTYNQVVYGGRTHRVWHIHGEARKPGGIIIGHYYYGQLLTKWMELLRERENRQYRNQQSGEPPIMDSWLDAFILGDVYVLGFGYDLAESDLWWLLNRKKREKAKHGRVIFYEPVGDNGPKHMLLRTMGAEVRSLGYECAPEDYKLFYADAIADIEREMRASE